MHEDEMGDLYSEPGNTMPDVVRERLKQENLEREKVRDRRRASIAGRLNNLPLRLTWPSR